MTDDAVAAERARCAAWARAVQARAERLRKEMTWGGSPYDEWGMSHAEAEEWAAHEIRLGIESGLAPPPVEPYRRAGDEGLDEGSDIGSEEGS